MTELLAPAGSMEALKAAISNGCDAIYLGMQKFGARAYSSNFDLDTLKEALTYAHLRNVKIYVTMNTIVFESEIEEMKAQMHALNDLGVDGVIVQDLAALDYLVKNFMDMEAHCSTQIGIDDLEGTLLFKALGAKRVVLSREVPIEKVKEIRRQADIPLEIFVHGALCVSYSGNCLMSGLIGYRSGNRGRCVGSCRKAYELIDKTTDKVLVKNYILSTKDLNTIDHIEALKGIDSLKIEGRMKEPAYVANVVSKYRKALDHSLSPEDKADLSKTFNRTYTKGYLFSEPKRAITNTKRPNNFGYEIGKITKILKDTYEITLNKPLSQNDNIRISRSTDPDPLSEDVNLTVVKLYDKDGNLINRADRVCYLKLKEKLSKGDTVYITKDFGFYKSLEATLDHEFRRFKLDINLYAHPGAKLIIEAHGLGQTYLYESDEVVSEAINNPTTEAQIIQQFSRLKDTVFELGTVHCEALNAFLPAKLLNVARRQIVDHLYTLRLSAHQNRTSSVTPKSAPITFPPQRPFLTASVTTHAQYEACIQAGIREVYFDTIVRRNQNNYRVHDGQLLIGGYGGIYHYRDTNPFVTDYSLNVVNAASCHELFRLGAKRVTLSYELNRSQIEDLQAAYETHYGGLPNLEMMVYGRAPLIFTKYCPLETAGQCGHCRTKQYELKDDHGTFPILCHEDCSTTILNGKVLNLLDELPLLQRTLSSISAYRLHFTTEGPEAVISTVQTALGKLAGTLTAQAFNPDTDTRGHFNREIL